MAPASKDEKRGGRCGRVWGELEKNSGDGGCRRLIEGPLKVKRSLRGRRRGFLRTGGASMASLDSEVKAGGRGGRCSEPEGGVVWVEGTEVGGRSGGGGGRQ